jgi:hypothetical protein
MLYQMVIQRVADAILNDRTSKPYRTTNMKNNLIYDTTSRSVLY